MAHNNGHTISTFANELPLSIKNVAMDHDDVSLSPHSLREIGQANNKTKPKVIHETLTVFNESRRNSGDYLLEPEIHGVSQRDANSPISFIYSDESDCEGKVNEKRKSLKNPSKWITFL